MDAYGITTLQQSPQLFYNTGTPRGPEWLTGVNPLGSPYLPCAENFRGYLSFTLPERKKGEPFDSPLDCFRLGLSDGMFRLIGHIGDAAVASAILVAGAHFDFEALARIEGGGALLCDLERGRGDKAEKKAEVKDSVGGVVAGDCVGHFRVSFVSMIRFLTFN